MNNMECELFQTTTATTKNEQQRSRSEQAKPKENQEEKRIIIKRKCFFACFSVLLMSDFSVFRFSAAEKEEIRQFRGLGASFVGMGRRKRR